MSTETQESSTRAGRKELPAFRATIYNHLTNINCFQPMSIDFQRVSKFKQRWWGGGEDGWRCAIFIFFIIKKLKIIVIINFIVYIIKTC